MDLSKLPKLSDTPRPPPPQAPPPQAEWTRPLAAALPDASSVRPGVGAEVWLSLIIGLLIIAMNVRFGQYVMAKLSGREIDTQTTWTAGPKAGQPVTYWELQGHTALTECAMFIFGLAMVLEGILLVVVHSRLPAKVPIIAVALLITLAATALNLYVSLRIMGTGLLPLMSLLAVAFGGYIAAYEWRLLNLFRGAKQT